MIKIELTIEQVNSLLQLIDISIKAGGSNKLTASCNSSISRSKLAVFRTQRLEYLWPT